MLEIDCSGLNSMRIWFALILTCLLQPAFATPKAQWQQLQTGIEYYHFVPDNAVLWSHIQAFRIDPKQYHFQLVFAQDQHLTNSSVKTLSESQQALIGINGGFFSTDFGPIGLRISNGKLRSPLKAISWWGIFYLQGGVPHIDSQSQFKYRPNIEFALQSGPRLLIDSKIPKLKIGVAQRTALGITRQGKIVIMVTQNYPMTTQDLALTMRDILECTDALNLDGGSSTQLYAKIGAFNLLIPGYSNIADALVVTPKNAALTPAI